MFSRRGYRKKFFCEFLCPPSLRTYYNSNPIIDHDKDSQVALSTNFIINLDELKQIKSSSSKLKSWLSQTSVKVRLPYDKTDSVRHRIASFVGNTNDIEFLRSDMGYSRWICFRIKGTKHIGKNDVKLLEQAWFQAYNIYKSNSEDGELSKSDLQSIKAHSDIFQLRNSETELIEKHLSPSTKEEGEFMTTTDILQYLQERVGNCIKLNTITLGRSLTEFKFYRVGYRIGNNVAKGFWVKRLIF